jgi:hypothetical protein
VLAWIAMFAEGIARQRQKNRALNSFLQKPLGGQNPKFLQKAKAKQHAQWRAAG